MNKEKKRRFSRKKEHPGALPKHIEDQLSEIYGNEDGSMPDMSSIEFERKNGWLYTLIIFGVSLILAIFVFWFGFFLPTGDTNFAEDDVIVTVNTDEQITSGEEITVRVRYRNAQKIDLNNVQLSVKFPEGFVYERASIDPINETHDLWNLGSLSKEDGGFIDIHGKLYGELDQAQSFRVFLEYTPENFSSQFQKVDHVEVVTGQKPYELTLSVQDQLVSGVRTPFGITIKKQQNLENTYKNMYVEITSAGLLSIEQSEPKSDIYNQYRWNIDQAKEEQTISITGTFAAPSGDDHAVRVSLFGEPVTGTKRVVLLDDVSVPLSITQTDVNTRLVINGTTDKVTIIPGEKMIASIVVRNDGEVPVKDVRLKLRIDAPSDGAQSIMKWDSIVDPLDGDIIGKQLDATTRRGFIGWSSKQLPAFSEMIPGAQATVDIQLPVKTSDDQDLFQFSTFNMALIAQLEYTVNGEVKTISSNPMDLVIQSDLALEQEYEVDEPSKTYSILWKLTNTFHDIKDIEISTSFFGDVWIHDEALTGAPAGEIVFDGDAKKVKWKIPSMPTALDVLALKLPVQVKGTHGGQTQLTDKIRLDAIDAVTGEKILIILDPIPLVK